MRARTHTCLSYMLVMCIYTYLCVWDATDHTPLSMLDICFAATSEDRFCILYKCAYTEYLWIHRFYCPFHLVLDKQFSSSYAYISKWSQQWTCISNINILIRSPIFFSYSLSLYFDGKEFKCNAMQCFPSGYSMKMSFRQLKWITLSFWYTPVHRYCTAARSCHNIFFVRFWPLLVLVTINLKNILTSHNSL